MISIVQFGLPYNYINFIIFCASDTAPHHSLWDCFCVYTLLILDINISFLWWFYHKCLILSRWLLVLLICLCLWLPHLNYRFRLSETRHIWFCNRPPPGVFLLLGGLLLEYLDLRCHRRVPLCHIYILSWRYFTGKIQTLQLIVLALFGAVY